MQLALAQVEFVFCKKKPFRKVLKLKLYIMKIMKSQSCTVDDAILVAQNEDDVQRLLFDKTQDAHKS